MWLLSPPLALQRVPGASGSFSRGSSQGHTEDGPQMWTGLSCLGAENRGSSRQRGHSPAGVPAGPPELASLSHPRVPTWQVADPHVLPPPCPLEEAVEGEGALAQRRGFSLSSESPPHSWQSPRGPTLWGALQLGGLGTPSPGEGAQALWPLVRWVTLSDVFGDRLSCTFLCCHCPAPQPHACSRGGAQTRRVRGQAQLAAVGSWPGRLPGH